MKTHVKTGIVILAILMATILAMMAIPLSQAIAPPRGDYSETVDVEYDYGIWATHLKVPSKESAAIRFGLPGAQCTFIDGDDEATKTQARFLETHESPRKTLDNIVDWIHDCIEYEEDTQLWDYWQPPSETLRKGTGDCEDMAILGASMAQALGYRTILVFEDEHALFAMECEPRITDTVIEYDGRTYVTADPTSNRTGTSVDPICVTDTIWTPFNIGFMMVMAFGGILCNLTIFYLWRRRYIG